MTDKLYLAYGSNLCIEQMKIRCPAAEPLGTTTIFNNRLVFRGVADIEKADGFKVPVGVWRITKECERALDVYEGIKSGLYVKRNCRLRDGAVAMFYKMKSTDILPPSDYYLDVIREGYGDFGLDLAALKEAVKHSKQHRRASRGLLERQERRDRRWRERKRREEEEAFLAANDLPYWTDPALYA
jgi:hypothetical protein